MKKTKRRPTFMLVVFPKDMTLMEIRRYETAIMTCGGSVRGSVSDVNAAMVEGNVREVRRALKGKAEVYGPRSVQGIAALLERRPELESTIGIWRELLKPVPPMSPEEARRLQAAIHSEPQ